MTFYIFYEPFLRPKLRSSFLQFPMILLEKTHNIQKLNKYKKLSKI